MQEMVNLGTGWPFLLLLIFDYWFITGVLLTADFRLLVMTGVFSYLLTSAYWSVLIL